MEHKTELVKNTFIIALGKLSTQILSFLLLSLYTSRLTPAEYGTYDFLVNLQLLIIPLLTLYMEESMFRFLIDADTEKKKKSIISQTFIYVGTMTIIFIAVASIVCGIISYEYALPFILYIVSCVFIGMSNALARGLSKIKLYSISNFILGFSTILLNILFISIFNMGVYGLLYSIVIANFITSIIVFIKLKFFKYVDLKKFNKKQMKEMLKYSLPLVPSNLSWYIISLSDRLMLTGMSGTAVNGIYSVANKFPYILNTVFSYFHTAWKESAAKIVKEKNFKKSFNSIFLDTKKLLFAGMVCLIAGTPFVFSLLIDSAYQEAYMFIPLLALSTYFSCLSNFYGGIFAAYKNTKIMGTTTIVAAVINIGINLIFIPMFGIWAAVASTFVSGIVVYLYRIKAMNRYVKLVRTKMLGPALVILIVTLGYYSNSWLFKGIGLAVALSYSYLINQKALKRFFNGVLRKIKSFKKK